MSKEVRVNKSARYDKATLEACKAIAEADGHGRVCTVLREAVELYVILRGEGGKDAVAAWLEQHGKISKAAA